MARLTPEQTDAVVEILTVVPDSSRRTAFVPFARLMGVPPNEFDSEFTRVRQLLPEPRWDFVFSTPPRPLHACRWQHHNHPCFIV
jgi:hypothetical protein